MPDEAKPPRKPWVWIGVIVVVILVIVLVPHDLRKAVADYLRDVIIKMHTAPRQ
ncbi:MAG TPA: hypothetical protein VH988_01570 [Thermoanaerobaculia bacterium]|jgi:hypothetical protein|nr:hypothetical protein [Thermoanaerobaculia bacterium]